jgi:patatin-related protein
MLVAATEPSVPECNLREIRLGLVCYGGVSLAIYMHGITKELQKLVVASRALEDDPERNPFPRDTSEYAYWQALQVARERSADRALPRVVIDVVAGTSAGGINGVFLAKALAHNLSQDALRDLWFDKGDIQQLLGGSWWKESAHVSKFLLDLVRGDAQGLLDGQAMLGWLLDALKEMDGTRSTYQPPAGAANSLMPEGHPLQLFVTTTDYYGYRQPLTISDPPTVSERRNRHVLSFGYRRAAGQESTQFDHGHNGALAFSARATSSFPGAFPPVRVADASELPKGFEDEFFRAYELSGAAAKETYFIDGGVLNNYPFRPAVDAIAQMRSESEVTRYLLYLQPDPGSEVQDPDGEPPNYFGTIWAGLSSVAASQPILEDLLRARDFNERVRRVGELVEGTRRRIAEILAKELPHGIGDPLPEADEERLREMKLRLDARAEEEAGYLFGPYLRLRAYSTLDVLARGICQVCNYREEEGNVAFLVRMIVDRWARGKKLIDADTSDAERRQLLEVFDLGYTRRRFAFVLQAIDGLYEETRRGALQRGDLDRAKKVIYDRIDHIKELIQTAIGGLEATAGSRLRALFPADKLANAIASGVDLEAFSEEFARENGDALTAVVLEVGEVIRREKEGNHSGLYNELRTITADWTPEQREEVMVRFLGFPFWDAMIYPITALTEPGELRPLEIVRVSPADSTRLGLSTAKDKLKGVKLAHFGAFLHREWRENDYLWGRLDAAERLIGLILQPDHGCRAQDWEIKPALAAILAEEKPALTLVQPLIQQLEQKVAALADGPGVQP